jgi:hypothetical protein
MCNTSSLNGLSDGTPVPMETRHLTLPSSGSSPYASCAWSYTSCTTLFAPVVHKLLALPAYRDRVEEGGGCRGRPAGLLYRHAVKEVAVATRRAVARKADCLACLLARRAHEAVVVSLCFAKYTLSLHLAACIRRILKQRVLLQTLLSDYLPHRQRKLLHVKAALHLALNCHPVSRLAEHTVRE